MIVWADGTLPGCAAAALKAVRLGVTLRTLPGACRGLTPADLERAVKAVVGSVADHGPKTHRRQLAAAADARLGYLISVAQRVRPRPTHRLSPAPEASAATGVNIPVGAAALVAWLLTAVTGAWLLLGLRRKRRPPPVVRIHFGLATAGLLTWIAYLASGTAAVAWLATAFLLPVAGLGLATLLATVPDSAPRSARMPVVTITIHGICATATLLLVLLAAITAR